MTTVIKFGPYDPGPEMGDDVQQQNSMHGYKSYKFFHADMSAQKSSKNTTMLLLSNAKGLAQLYLFLQVFFHYFLDYVRRVAIIVKVYRAQKALSRDHGQSLELAPKVDASKPRILASPTTEWQLKERNLGAGFLAHVKVENLRQKFCSSTSCTTSVFEVANKGLPELLADIKEEMRDLYGNLDINYLPNLGGKVVACCELVWSVPSAHRTYWSELSLEHEADRLMRANEQMAASVFGAGPLWRQIQPGGVEQRASGPNGLRVYRRFHPELVKVACERAQNEHGKIWRFEEHPVSVDLQWPVIGGGLEKTTVVVLNLILLKFKHHMF